MPAGIPGSYDPNNVPAMLEAALVLAAENPELVALLQQIQAAVAGPAPGAPMSGMEEMMNMGVQI